MSQDYYLILYDIRDDGRRNRLFKLLESYGASFQFSVFEARLDPRRALMLSHGIESLIDREEDKVAVLRLCESCRRSVSLLGRQASVICRNVIVV